jgi:uncharacterized protein
MTELSTCIYEGTVVHKRLVPRKHGFSYRVFALCLDVDEIDEAADRLRFFSRRRRNVLSFWDEDLGEAGGSPVGTKAREILASSGLSKFGASIELVCYPRLWGYVFNPLSVYFCRDAAGNIGAVIYEVSNTFAERKSYVIPTGAADRQINQHCAKEMYVSPFTGRTGTYGFHCLPPGERVVIGVNFRDAGAPVLKTHFSGERRPLTDAAISRLMLRYPLMTLKVISAIHFEAARLWAKGVPLADRFASPSYSFTLVDEPQRTMKHA